MIVRSFDTHAEIVLQSNHAWLARKMLEPWQEIYPDLDWPPLLLATALHDQGWNPTDLEGTLADEKPLNFLKVCPQEAACIGQRSIDWAFALNRKCGILVAHHFHYLYGGKSHPDVKRLSQEWQERRDQALADLDLPQDWLSKHYEMLFWADALSLLVVCRPSPFTEILSLKTSDYDMSLTQLSCERYELKPWPFSNKQWNYEYEFRVLANCHYQNGDDYALHIKNSKTQIRRVTITPGTSSGL